MRRSDFSCSFQNLHYSRHFCTFAYLSNRFQLIYNILIYCSTFREWNGNSRCEKSICRWCEWTEGTPWTIEVQELPLVLGKHLSRKSNAIGLLFLGRGIFVNIEINRKYAMSSNAAMLFNFRFKTLRPKIVSTQWVEKLMRKSAAAIAMDWAVIKCLRTQNGIKSCPMIIAWMQRTHVVQLI